MRIDKTRAIVTLQKNPQKTKKRYMQKPDSFLENQKTRILKKVMTKMYQPQQETGYFDGS